ncbi:hypothetical protein Sme01_54610 [Sphaerisporangium melleum]|uniref:Uncharacterized protein n=1 Tax=Sphaerisporangium melleum TaxID=321316 RepID=A0A917R6D3_9ACTN|nr:hypothetical protein [Sphaerisporangium melleum]GGK92172.1 hypothetical protein GCM10007964_38460 [Sphaerisporangium melleum]GII72985.1 hypothetical protein Sme01_54610 [Sphaerisporangium melleum]
MGVERRHALASAALGRTTTTSPEESPGQAALTGIAGQIIDISPHLVILENPDGEEERLVIAPWATAWHGRPTAPAELPAGTRVMIRARQSGRVAERLWGDITRVTGVILALGRDGRDLTVVLDCGPHRGTRNVVVPYGASGRIRVRHPQFEPGFLFDAIGTRRDGVTRVALPATSQPTYRAASVPSPPPAYRAVQSRISGTAAWSDAFDDGEAGVAYPMLERADSECEDAGVSCTGLPYLALGSMLYVGNVCESRGAVLPIVACGCMAGRFCDRCVECGTSPRGRIAELSPLSFVELGGELTNGCFNARVGLG